MSKRITLKKKLREGRPLFGLVHALNDLAVAGIAAAAGIDWLFIEGEHSALSFTEIERVLQVLPPSCPGVVRVPLADEIWVKKVLDSGADGIIFPQINTAEEAARAVSWCRYPPQGRRGIGLARAHGYGKTFGEYLDHANEDVCVIVQVEQKEGAENIEEIVRVEGIDVIFVGPYDLSASLGLTGRVDHPEVRSRIDHIFRTAKEAGLYTAIFGMDAAAVQPYLEAGFDLFAVGLDFDYFSRALQRELSLFRRMGG